MCKVTREKCFPRFKKHIIVPVLIPTYFMVLRQDFEHLMQVSEQVLVIRMLLTRRKFIFLKK